MHAHTNTHTRSQNTPAVAASKIPTILVNNVAKILAHTVIPWMSVSNPIGGNLPRLIFKNIPIGQYTFLSHDLTTYLARHTPATVCRQAGELRGSDGVSRQDVACPRQTFMNNFIDVSNQTFWPAAHKRF
jgi:hypothetical protein